ncbi:MAG: L,D-transpeptidase family protein [Verrucomicrobiota bacterium]
MSSTSRFTITTILIGFAFSLFIGCSYNSSSPAYYGADGTQYLGALGGSPIGRQPYTPGGPRVLQDNVSYWDGDNVSGPASIKIDLSDQKAYFYKGDQIVGVSQVSTGREGYSTPSGKFKISQKNKDHRSNLYGDYVDSAGNVVMRDIGVRTHAKPAGTTFLGAPMWYFMRVHGAVGMHAGYIPGYPASHGCIRLPEQMAKKFYEHASHGTPVTITH